MLADKQKLWLMVVAVLAVAVVAAAILIPYQQRRARAAREGTVTAISGTLLNGQATFHKTDFCGIGALVYANPRDGRGFEDLYEIQHADGRVTTVGLIARELAEAVDPEHAHRGYYYMDLLRRPAQPNNSRGWVMAGPLHNPTTGTDPSVWYGVCAIPYPHEPGLATWVLDSSGNGFGWDNGGKPLPECFPIE